MRVATASSFWSRFRGLLGTRFDRLAFDALHLTPCKSIHTFGMRYALDVAFLNRHNKVIRVRYRVMPMRWCSAPPGTVSVLERPAAQRPWLHNGQYIQTEGDLL